MALAKRQSVGVGDGEPVRSAVGLNAPVQIAIAERPSIGKSVSAALARSQCEAAVIALLRNTSARIAAETFELLSDREYTWRGPHGYVDLHPDLEPVQIFALQR